jgi:transposase-like protein
MFYCPACKSQEIFAVAGGYVGQIYLCKDCGYRGSFVLEIDDVETLRKIEKDKKGHT